MDNYNYFAITGTLVEFSDFLEGFDFLEDSNKSAIKRSDYVIERGEIKAFTSYLNKSSVITYCSSGIDRLTKEVISELTKSAASIVFAALSGDPIEKGSWFDGFVFKINGRVAAVKLHRDSYIFCFIFAGNTKIKFFNNGAFDFDMDDPKYTVLPAFEV